MYSSTTSDRPLDRKEAGNEVALLSLNRLKRRFKAQRYATLAAFQADLEDESVRSPTHSRAMSGVRESWDCLRQRLQVAETPSLSSLTSLSR